MLLASTPRLPPESKPRETRLPGRLFSCAASARSRCDRQELQVDEELAEWAPGLLGLRRGRLRWCGRTLLGGKLGAVLLGENARERERGQIAVADEDLAEEPARLRLLGECLLELVLGEKPLRDEELAELTPRELDRCTLHVLPIGSEASIVQSFSTGDDEDGLAQDLQVVTHKSPARERAGGLDIGRVEVLIGDTGAFCHLGRSREAGRDTVPVIPALGDLAPDHVGRPGPWADETEISAEDVQELWELVEIPRLEQMPAGPGQVVRVRFVQPSVSAFEAHLLECGSPEGPELEQAERSAPGDPPLAIEEATSIAPRASHVRRHREKQREQQGREQREQRCCDAHIEESLGDVASMSRSLGRG